MTAVQDLHMNVGHCSSPPFFFLFLLFFFFPLFFLFLLFFFSAPFSILHTYLYMCTIFFNERDALWQVFVVFGDW